MRRRFSRTPFRRRRFKKRVSWLTNAEIMGQEAIELRSPIGDPGEPVFIPLATLDNDWINTHPRFAKANDLMQLRRIVGKVRIGMYRADATQNATDYLINYGLCLIKGDYDETGTFTVKDEPDPGEPSDEDDKWLFKNFVVLSTGNEFTEYTGLVYGSSTSQNVATTGTDGALHPVISQSWPLRQVMMSTDADLPNGSFIDLKTRRRVQYGEKLYLVVTVHGMDDASMSIFANWSLRVLVS